ncbi:TcaA NTF2-like domain-containing protein [Halalkalibacter urbisdiaboli]|uniref:TcaA NTF2-like domain-containing protein n=1 Tax=Halalkalibacter urbisdiaboli TaxID=1960589 RepID=UPI000B436EE6|nr:hypothetical protein [Halalkalibacter urbisdiaboli]
MKKTIWLLFLGITMVLLVSCNNEPKALLEVSDEEATLVSNFVTDYKMTMVEAVNSGDFNELESYLITNNSFYHSLRRYVSDLQRDKVKKRLLHFEVKNVFKTEDGQWFADANESVELDDNNHMKTEERFVRFELIEKDTQSFRIVTIKKQ